MPDDKDPEEPEETEPTYEDSVKLPKDKTRDEKSLMDRLEAAIRQLQHLITG